MKKPIPFEFLLDDLPPGIIIKPAIGMFYIYYDGKIIFIFRRTIKNPQHNGIWIATTKENHINLKKHMPAVTDFELEPGIDTSWLLLSDRHNNFEDAAIALCKLASNKDPRIGKVTPASAALF